MPIFCNYFKKSSSPLLFKTRFSKKSTQFYIEKNLLISGILADDVGAERARHRDDHKPAGAGQEEVRHVLAQGGRQRLWTD